jgi:glycosyltransferase involved in cell wall biosynthesis
MVMVSVVTPFLNAGRYLPEAIASVQNQMCHDWEMVLVDDGSTDDGAGIVARAASADSRIRLLRHPSGAPAGAAAARNFGILQARGEFVGFLDADDVYEPNNLQSRLQAFEAHPEVMMVYGPTRWWHPGAEHRDWTEGMRREAGRVHEPPELLNRVALMQLGPVPCTCGVMIRRCALELTGGFDDAFHLYEDQTLWVKLMVRFPIYVTPVVGARYRQRNDSVTAHAQRAGVYLRTRPHEARLAFLTWVGDYARTTGLTDISVDRALRLALASYGNNRAMLALADRLTLARHHTVKKIRRSVGTVLRFLQCSGSDR